MSFMTHGITRLAMGVTLALLLYLLRRWREEDFSLVEELKMLLLPSLMLGAGALFTGASWLDAGTTAATALGLALGLNSKTRIGKDPEGIAKIAEGAAELPEEALVFVEVAPKQPKEKP